MLGFTYQQPRLAVPETVDQITEDGWDKVLSLICGALCDWCARRCRIWARMIFGDIVNVSSQAGKQGYADVPSYCASKFGLLGYAEELAIMW